MSFALQYRDTKCDSAPCDEGMFGSDHGVRLRAFIVFILKYGKHYLAECVYNNMQKGVLYDHSKDYDGLGSIDEVINLLLQHR